MGPKIERVTDSFGIGEGPHWDVASQKLFFIDCVDLFLVRYDSSTNKVTKVSTAPNRPSFIIPIEGKKDHFLVSFGKEVVSVKWDGESDNMTIVEKLGMADDADETPDNRFNDGKCDSFGRLWTGTSTILPGKELECPPVGILYSFNSKKRMKGHTKQVRMSNGFAFNDKTNKMFYVDSLQRSVYRFDLDVANGTISNKHVWFTTNRHNIPGIPDGMTIDTDGNLWLAVFGGSRILKIDGNKAETLLDTIHMPAFQTTSVAFGGQNLDELYVTSGSITFEGVTPERPANGALYRVTGLGVKGLPANNFKLD